jgi:hypothetical protein
MTYRRFLGELMFFWGLAFVLGFVLGAVLL